MSFSLTLKKEIRYLYFFKKAVDIIPVEDIATVFIT